MSRRQNVVRKEERVSPTPETLAKLRPAPWAHLDIDSQRAAVALAEGYHFIIRDLGYRTGGFERRIQGEIGVPVHVERLIGRYLTWAEAMQQDGEGRYINPIESLIYWGDAAREIEQRLGWKAGRLHQVLIDGLCRYLKLFPDT